MKKELMIPLSMPARVVVEPNPPRQGYSHLTWNGLNQYYLQNVMDKQEYEEILQNCRKIAFQVYALNREENRFLDGTTFNKLSRVTWILTAAAVLSLLLSEVAAADSNAPQTWHFIIVGLSVAMTIMVSIYNFWQEPSGNIYINYEEFLRKSIRTYFETLNAKYVAKNGVRFDVSNNDLNWLEIYIPEKLQMPFSKGQIARHIDILDSKAIDEYPDNPRLTQLYQIVDSYEEKDRVEARGQQHISQVPALATEQDDRSSDESGDDFEDEEFGQGGMSERRMLHFGRNSSRRRQQRKTNSRVSARDSRVYARLSRVTDNSDKYNIPAISGNGSDYDHIAEARSMRLHGMADHGSSTWKGKDQYR